MVLPAQDLTRSGRMASGHHSDRHPRGRPVLAAFKDKLFTALFPACPVSASDASQKKDRSQRKSRMDQRTRERPSGRHS